MILFRKVDFFNVLVVDVWKELILIESTLQGIKPKFTKSPDLEILEKRFSKADSKFQNWTLRLNAITSDAERMVIYKSYDPDMQEIGKLIQSIDCELIRTRPFLERPVAVMLKKQAPHFLKAAIVILGMFGINIQTQGLLGRD